MNRFKKWRRMPCVDSVNGFLYARGGLELIKRRMPTHENYQGYVLAWSVIHKASGRFVSPLIVGLSFKEAMLFADSILKLTDWRARYIEPTPELKAQINMFLLMLGKDTYK